MAHTRIRKFNTGVTYPEQNLDNDLCQAVITQGGKTVYLRGQCPQNLDDAVNIDSHDPVEQTHKVMQKGLLPLLPVTPDVDRPSTFQARFLDRAGRCAGAFGLGEVGFECCRAGWRAGTRP